MGERRREVRRAGDPVAHRKFEALGVPWQAFELKTAAGPMCLIFESTFAVRRIAHYPSNWRELTDAELVALSWER